ncbi:hypothetical protein BAUCODRAFT_68347, partial [Baudoinia panamericana UAMH 10762]
VRHYLVRLGSWHQKSVLAVRTAHLFPALFDNHFCQWLELPNGIRLAFRDPKTTLSGALRRMAPPHQQHQVEELRERLQTLRDFDFEHSFTETFDGERVSLSTHAEVFPMEHSYFQGLQVVANDRYIGSSRPSCYCCSLYMRHHGTAWIRWKLALLSRPDDDVIYKHTLFVMNRVVEHIRRDVMNEIEHRFPRRQRRPDSTSGILTLSL